MAKNKQNDAATGSPDSLEQYAEQLGLTAAAGFPIDGILAEARTQPDPREWLAFYAKTISEGDESAASEPPPAAEAAVAVDPEDQADPPPPLPAITLVCPLGETKPGSYQDDPDKWSGHIEVGNLTMRQRMAAIRLKNGLRDSHELIESPRGLRHVDDFSSTLRWLLDRIADESEKSKAP